LNVGLLGEFGRNKPIEATSYLVKSSGGLAHASFLRGRAHASIAANDLRTMNSFDLGEPARHVSRII
jgi:hypothetical protein